ncbi:hypothetical protein ITJ38_13020 [Agreia pratensis]|uniref:LuxR C-terminal-related transcriptional regulator n=1 Tax=Agreia pratensis TaxID=150121 RepID=UPI00188D9F56|nr:LuxR C-terminal-related transcriptional regulator [Agreia pratensis]MBF4635329.1 hypothetical protein [Agreia pratensis]
MRKILGYAVAPVTSIAAAFVWWLSESDALSQEVPVRAETFVTSPYAVLVFVGMLLALAISPVRPTWALGLSMLLLMAQLLFWPARFSQTSWTGYLVYLPMVVIVSSSVLPHARRRCLAGVLVGAVAVAALLTVPALSMSGVGGTLSGKPWSVQPEITQSIIVWLVVCVGATIGLWAFGRQRLASQGSSMTHQTPARLPVADNALDHLTPREREVFMLVALGRSNGAIAQELFIVEPTVKSHVGNILAKLNLVSRSELIVYAYDHAIVQPAYMASAS